MEVKKNCKTNCNNLQVPLLLLASEILKHKKKQMLFKTFKPMLIFNIFYDKTQGSIL